MIVVGIAGRKRHGKDTLADFAIKFLSERGFTAMKRHLADSLKEEVIRIVANHTGDSFAELMQRATTAEGKEEFRLGWQWWGTDIWRRRDPARWIKLLREHLEADRDAEEDVVFVPDVRFPNEVELVKEMGGYIIRVQRPGLDDGDGHASEHALDDYQEWNAEILNDSDLPALEEQTRQLMTLLFAYGDGV